MSKATPATDWNVLTTPWLEVMDVHGRLRTLSVLDALRDAADLHRIVSASPLDLFAIHRFLLTLLYWQAEDSEGVTKLRKALLSGSVPRGVVAGLKGEAGQFDLFDPKRPFLQDPTALTESDLSPASMFGEMASGTNISHFHHSDDRLARICLRCATLGLLRLSPWTPSDGQGKAPTLHGAPTVMALALGANLCEIFGLNLISTAADFGRPQWTGRFKPPTRKSGAYLLEGLTWNPRRVNLREPSLIPGCWRCGDESLPTVGPISFAGNPACKGSKELSLSWRDPMIFYRDDGRTVRTTDEGVSAKGGDTATLFRKVMGKRVFEAPQAGIVAANPTHSPWLLVFPCTAANAAHNKSFDHRCETLAGFDGEAPPRARFWHDSEPWQAGDTRLIPRLGSVRPTAGAATFVRLAGELDAASWSVLAQAADKSLNHSPAAFDIFTGLYWPLRNKDRTCPSRNAAWLALKLMATAGPLRPTSQRHRGPYEPWRDLVLRDSSADQRVYPRSIPIGRQLESEIRNVLRRHSMKPSPSLVDWPGLCQFIHNVTP